MRGNIKRYGALRHNTVMKSDAKLWQVLQHSINMTQSDEEMLKYANRTRRAHEIASTPAYNASGFSSISTPLLPSPQPFPHHPS